ncbi:hypothetical protein TWF694_010356 [Orbilia ellipsospora]|uniref:Methyltransferase type 11 domain-containing protein n=1 Tax=Orbilia ellipsospora TaxID=2528407 RepID=A0AAV9XAJ5_9PEZI
MSEKTFKAFTQTDGKNYARFRRNYHQTLYNLVLDYHTSKNGAFDTILDVGCGPGTAVSTLAPRFAHAYGFDASQGMIDSAKSLGGETSTGEPITFAVSGAEQLGNNIDPPVADGSVDMIISATAAHWFDMAAFWPRAAKVLKPGGTVAIWCGAKVRALPPTPQCGEIDAAINRFRDNLKDFAEAGNLIAEGLYVELPTPWSLPTPVAEFDEAAFVRKEWGNDKLDSLPGNEFWEMNHPGDLDFMEAAMGTASPVVRWREANPELVGTEKDVVRVMRREMEQILAAAGYTVKAGEKLLYGGTEAVLMLFTKKA